MGPWYLFLPLDSSEQHVKGKNHVTLQTMGKLTLLLWRVSRLLFCCYPGYEIIGLKWGFH